MNTKVDSMIQDNSSSQSSLIPMAIIGTLFFVFGFVTWINGALIPFLQMVCQLTETQALMVAFSFYVAYVVMALPMSWVLDKVGYRMGMVLGLVLIAVGALIFIPAALTQEFAIFLFGQFVIGSGLTILQTASNPYVVKIGPEESAAARIAIMGLINKAAGALAPLMFTAMVLGEFSHITAASLAELSDVERVAQIDAMATGLITPYIGMAIALAALAVGLKYSSLPEIELDKVEDNAIDTGNTSILQFPQLILGALALFFYVGVEVIAGDTIGLYGSRLGIANATSLTTLTMIGMVVGYLLGLALIPRVLKQNMALLLSAVLGILLTFAIVLADPTSTNFAFLWSWIGYADLPDVLTYVALLGLANAMVWPAIWPLALAELGKFTARGSAILIMGIAGGAILPLVYGVLSDELSSQQAYWAMLPCYLFIAFYAVKGYKLRNW